jgi:predicted phosphate transport protein (TIGR00153 family)
MFSFTPKEDKFNDLFISTSELILKSANALNDFINDLDNSEENLKLLKQIEHDGDVKQHEILKQLNLSFITPFDREDIYDVATDMDNIIDYIESAASRFVMLNVNRSTKEAEILSKMIIACANQIIILMKELKNMKKSKIIKDIIIEINRIEEQGDLVSRKVIKDLFRMDIPVIEVIKWREIYQYFENSLDACEDLANVVEGIVMKNA